MSNATKKIKKKVQNIAKILLNSQCDLRIFQIWPNWHNCAKTGHTANHKLGNKL